jgi:hypothetical protein
MLSSATEANMGRLMHRLEPLWVPPQSLVVKDMRQPLTIAPIKNASAFLPNDTANKSAPTDADNQKSNINVKIEAKPTVQQVTKEPVNKKAETPASTMKSTALVYLDQYFSPLVQRRR